MIKKCCSAHRCARIECTKCARRYARRVARDFHRTSQGQVYRVTIAAGINDLGEFGRWRISTWNVIAYRREVCRWWHGVSFRIWLCQDLLIRGIVALGSITKDEFQAVLGARGSVTLYPTPTGSLADKLFEIVRPGSIMADDPDLARYQPRQMTVRPRRDRPAPEQSTIALTPDAFDEPMPILIV